MPIVTPDRSRGVGKHVETPGVGDAIAQVADDAKAYATAQVELYKALALARWRAAQSGLIFGAVAAVLAMAALGALLVGLILTLAPLVGPLGATGIVIGITLVIAGVLGWLAGRKLGEAFGAIE